MRTKVCINAFFRPLSSACRVCVGKTPKISNLRFQISDLGSEISNFKFQNLPLAGRLRGETTGNALWEIRKAEDSDRGIAGTLECKHSFGSPYENKMVDALGIAPSSSVLQTDADLSQLNILFEISHFKM